MRNDKPTIEELAYQLWEANGRPHGTAESDWAQAQRQLQTESAAERRAASATVDDSLQQTFPASDPPASHLPDVPPVNADAKWAAAKR